MYCIIEIIQPFISNTQVQTSLTIKKKQNKKEIKKGSGTDTHAYREFILKRESCFYFRATGNRQQATGFSGGREVIESWRFNCAQTDADINDDDDDDKPMQTSLHR